MAGAVDGKLPAASCPPPRFGDGTIIFFTSYPGLCGPEEKRSGLRPKRDAFCHSSPNRACLNGFGPASSDLSQG